MERPLDLSRLDTALQVLVENPSCRNLDRGKTPSYPSHQTYDSTVIQTPEPRDEYKEFIDEHRDRLSLEHKASYPQAQFKAQRTDEEKRIFEANITRVIFLPAGSDTYRLASDNIKSRWVEQGIWDDRWNDRVDGLWKHECPRQHPLQDLNPEPEIQLDALSLYLKGCEERKAKTDEFFKNTVIETQSEPSRPFPQFIYQLSRERDRIQHESGVRDPLKLTYDINTKAYETVKDRWTERGTWHQKWGIMPGTFWKHEISFNNSEEAIFEDVASAVQAGTLMIPKNPSLLGPPSPTITHPRTPKDVPIPVSQESPPRKRKRAIKDDEPLEAYDPSRFDHPTIPILRRSARLRNQAASRSLKQAPAEHITPTSRKQGVRRKRRKIRG